MIDTKMLGLISPSNRIHLNSILDPTAAEQGRPPNFTNDSYILCNRTVPGFSFATKQWLMFDVDLIKDVDFNTEAFQTLLLPPDQKNMIHSLVRVHTNEGRGFDDVIKGKGKGMIFLLHGVPGVGKTLTAGECNDFRTSKANVLTKSSESVAEYTNRPLYTLSCGELGETPAHAEQNLAKALRLATSWKAIVLIDEADVFMEQRSTNDLKRNSLVSSKVSHIPVCILLRCYRINILYSTVFLRLLEYFEGLLILTTNRIGAFDPAFKSRIHLAIKYNPLTKAFRRDLWRVFIISASSGVWPEWMDNGCLDQLSMAELNGR